MRSTGSVALWAVCAPGLESFVAREISDMGLGPCRAEVGGVEFEGDERAVMLFNLRCRTASRLLMRFARFPVVHLAKLDKKCAGLPWENYFGPQKKIAVRAACRKSRIYHSGAAAQRVAQGIAQRLKRTALPDHGPGNIDERFEGPTVLARIERDICELSIDTSGEHLHRRGTKTWNVEAPIRSTLAAGILLGTGWTGQTPFVDPMCGSGTFAIEAASMAASKAPGRHRRFAFQDFVSWSEGLWTDLLARADEEERPVHVPIRCSDVDPRAVEAATKNIEAAGLGAFVSVAIVPADEVCLPEPRGQVVCNPPYGKRLHRGRPAAQALSALLALARAHSGWEVYFVTSAAGSELARITPVQAVGEALHSGGLKVRVFRL